MKGLNFELNIEMFPTPNKSFSKFGNVMQNSSQKIRVREISEQNSVHVRDGYGSNICTFCYDFDFVMKRKN